MVIKLNVRIFKKKTREKEYYNENKNDILKNRQEYHKQNKDEIMNYKKE